MKKIILLSFLISNLAFAGEDSDPSGRQLTKDLEQLEAMLKRADEGAGRGTQSEIHAILQQSKSVFSQATVSLDLMPGNLQDRLKAIIPELEELSQDLINAVNENLQNRRYPVPDDRLPRHSAILFGVNESFLKFYGDPAVKFGNGSVSLVTVPMEEAGYIKTVHFVSEWIQPLSRWGNSINIGELEYRTAVTPRDEKTFSIIQSSIEKMEEIVSKAVNPLASNLYLKKFEDLKDKGVPLAEMDPFSSIRNLKTCSDLTFFGDSFEIRQLVKILDAVKPLATKRRKRIQELHGTLADISPSSSQEEIIKTALQNFLAKSEDFFQYTVSASKEPKAGDKLIITVQDLPTKEIFVNKSLSEKCIRTAAEMKDQETWDFVRTNYQWPAYEALIHGEQK